MNLFLTGYRCTGKTTVGKLLARDLGWRFTDTDAEIVRTEKMTVREMVARHGWAYFREKERETVRRVCRKNRQVVATGGGVILNPDNVADMKAAGKVIWLRASPENILHRMNADDNTEGQRPALTDHALAQEVEDTLAERLPLYSAAADMTVDTDTADIDEICAVIRKQVLVWNS